MKEFLKGAFVIVALMAIVVGIFILLSDRVCRGNYSPAFKRTEQYKAMQCPN